MSQVRFLEFCTWFPSNVFLFAGAFGARNIPPIMKVIEVLGIQQGRDWGVATLNELRKFFKLKPYSTFGELVLAP